MLSSTTDKECKSDENHKVLSLVEGKIKFAEELKNKLNEIQKINTQLQGIGKLEKKIDAEIKFLVKALKEQKLKEDHVTCSNLNQLGAVVETATLIANVTAVSKTFESTQQKRFNVDIVGNNGKTWYKVILRHPKALHHLYLVGGRNGVKSMKNIGLEFLATAQLHPILFQCPAVCFVFKQGVSEPLAKCLLNMGVEVQGKIISLEDLNISPDPSLSESSSDEYSSDEEESSKSEEESLHRLSAEKRLEIPSTSENSEENEVSIPGETTRNCSLSYKKVNLDVTCMIAYVSSTSNGGSHFNFEDEFLIEQSKSERQTPVRPIIDGYFKDCELIVCQSARDHFLEILNTIGGESEKQRGHQLLQRCKIVMDENCLQNRLKIGGRIKPLSLRIFSTGLTHKAPTITSNRGFLRSAINKRVHFPVLYHEPRALTEQKEW